MIERVRFMAKNIAATVRELLAPTAESLGYILWDVEYVREGADNILRVTIDSDNGINIEDCEKMHRAIDPVLDEADPIEAAYTLEVSSPGLGRQIKTEAQAALCIGLEVNAKLYAPDEKGRRALRGLLRDYADGKVTVNVDGEDTELEVKKVAKLSLADDDF